MYSTSKQPPRTAMATALRTSVNPPSPSHGNGGSELLRRGLHPRTTVASIASESTHALRGPHRALRDNGLLCGCPLPNSVPRFFAAVPGLAKMWLQKVAEQAMQNTSSPRRGVRGSAPGSGGLMSATLAPIHCLVHTASAPNQTQHRHERAGAESGAGNRRRAAHTAVVASSPSPARRRCVIDVTVDEHVADDTAHSM